MHYTFAFKKDKNCPTFIDGVIHEFYQEGIYDEPMEQNWHYAGPDEILAKLPEKLVLITKDKCYGFDFCTDFGGHIVSEAFLKEFKTLKIGRWEVAELAIVNPKGISMDARRYFFIRQRREDQASSTVIDLERSNIQFRKTGEIKSINSLFIKDDAGLDVFSIDEVSLLGFVFLSEKAADVLNRLGLKGVEIVDTGGIGSVKSA